ncbi:DIL domain-domain-containing protein [Syncephalastrum racemosum]|uniref:DIL domain-domain-containing protein n=1 Tax=Syncephalastrum racemosum TaxID=13706 RepID=A0A1X2H9L3_SYNRA|nr:DIL domain-domain-containing protein [Syncephalastrum racemosum]
MNKLLSRSASSGDTAKVNQLLSDPKLRAYIDVDAKDDDGGTPLIYAACFGKVEIAQALLDAGAKTNIQDSSGASSQTKSARGRTVFDFVKQDNQKIAEILATNPRDSMSSTSSVLGRMAAEDDDNDDFDEDDFDENEFHWDKCMPDQMFVFSADDLSYILDSVICGVKGPVQSRHEICVPANVVFLSARFAHYFSSDELLQDVLEGALTRMAKATKENVRNIHGLALWITNLAQLLYYLKKDTGLVVATAEYQLRLSEMISETYTMMINDTERRLSKILGPAMLDYEQIPGMEDVNFCDDWQRFFRRSNSRRSVIVDGQQMRRHASSPGTTTASLISPQSITSLLSSSFYVLQSYEVHPTIIIQALAQFFHFLSCELFNRILTNKKLLSRSKALQIRMNLSYIEDWVRNNQLPSSLISYLNPSIQLLQLLQCLSQLDDIDAFMQTVRKFDALNSLQIKRCIVNYRYEVNEPRLPDEIVQYVVQLAEDTVRYKQQVRRQKSTRSSVALSRSQSRPESVSSFVEEPPLEPFEEDDVDDDATDIAETRDSKFMLPFSVPTTAHMVCINGWAPDASKERLVVPVIPDKWMEKLDKSSNAA